MSRALLRSLMSSRLLLLGTVLAAAFPSGCSGDPVRQAAIDALGPETGPENADHRPGTPCLLCHSDGGPASSSFVVAGTVYKTASGEEGAEGALVNFVDAAGNGPRTIPKTSASGNFFVREEEWPGVLFPLRVGLYADEGAAPTNVMTTLINREGSCNFCHRPIPKDPTKEQNEAARANIGPIFFTGAASGGDE